ncbi:MAG: hypothetical protein A3G81_06645 [Betaproteobacteria bacterium RIFCSPLOWO2_12_FULL_65_14]|nr:MAG: hypothetical protein A3G81_06645 [Betaproteobacteria bacterium RIFCSPLOWO2_12_FULL_65_14]
MADERDPKVSQRYRELGAEVPSRELDQAILAAAHRAADKPHAPLVTPVGRHRWYFSLGAAAVIVLAVAVTYHMQQEVPDPDSVAVPAAPEERAVDAQAKRPAEKPSPSVAPAPQPSAPEPARELAREPAAPPPQVFVPDPESQRQERQRELAREAPGARSDSVGAAASRPGTAAQAERRAEPGPAPAAKPMQAPVVEAPERMLERIVQLRKEGKHEEADKLLAEFKRRYPDHRIPENVVRP